MTRGLATVSSRRRAIRSPQKRHGDPALPAFVEPMLALLVEPFESNRHLYEVKWDGFRALAFVEAGGVRLAGRRKTDFTPRFPELVPALAALPPGMLLDGEIVHLKDGRPDFRALLARERAWSAASDVTRASRRRVAPVTFVAFDVLYERSRSVMAEPLRDRRRRLEDLLGNSTGPRLAMSEGQVGGGLALFEQVNAMGLEGVVAKRLDSYYEPGERGGAWAKFKRRQSLVAAIIGYLPDTTRGIKSLLLAADVDGTPRFVGQVGSGISATVHRNLLARFADLQQSQQSVPCTIKGARWLRPELACRVSFMEWTNGGKLRAPVFEALL